MIQVSFNMKALHCAVVTAIVFSLVSCTASHKISAVAVLPDTLPALPASEIDVPVKIAAKPILAKAELIVPIEFTSESWPNFVQPSCDFRYKYRFLRSPLAISCVNNKLGVSFTGSYQVT